MTKKQKKSEKEYVAPVRVKRGPFNLPKQYKMIAANFTCPHARGEYIRSTIDALIAERDWKQRRRQATEKVDE